MNISKTSRSRVGFFPQIPQESPLEKILTLITLHQNMANMFKSKTRFVVISIIDDYVTM